MKLNKVLIIVKMTEDNISFAKLSKKSKISFKTLRKYIKGNDEKCSIDFVVKLSEALEVDMKDIIL